MFRFLRFCAFLFVLLFTGNLMAAGYTCNTVETYTSCVEGYYLEACGTDSSAWTGTMATPVVGKTCLKCPDGYKCLGGQACPVRAGIHCAAGEYIMAGTTTCAKCPAGKVCDAPTDTTDEVATSTDRGITGACPANSYCPEGSSSPTACPTGYGNSAAGSDSQSDCYATCAPGTAVFSPGNACTTGSDSTIGMSWYSSKVHNVYYGRISSITYCPYGSDMRGMVPSLHDSAADCLVTVPGGYSSVVAEPDAQYIRISSVQGAFPLAEIQVISDGVAQGLSANSSMISAGNAIDGNLGTTAVVSATSAQGYMAMFRTSGVVPISNILFALGGNITRKIVIEISADATTWTTVFNGLVSSTSAAPAVMQHVPVRVRTNTQCVPGTYHGEVTVAASDVVECTACPTVADHKMTSYDNLTHGAYVYPNENLVLGSAQQTDWSSLVGGTTIESCRATYSYTNSRGYFIIEAVQYNTSTEKYDKNGNLYYTRPNAGYYLTTRYSDTYCDDSTRSMLYRDAQVCPAGSYCSGRTGFTSCGSGTYADNLGIDGLVSVGYYSAGGATTSTPKEGTGCVGGNGCGPLAAGYFSVQPGMKKKSPSYMSADCELVTIDGVANSMGCGFVDAGYYSTGGGTHPRPTASGNGCIAGENCGKVAPGYWSSGGGKSSTGEGAVAAGCFSTGGAKTAQPHSNEDCVAGGTCGELEAGYFSTGGAIKSNPTSADCVGYIGTDIWGSTEVPRKNVCGSILPGYYSTGGGVLPAPGNLDVTNSTALGFNVDLLNQGISTVRMGCRSQQECGMIEPGYWSAGAGTSSKGSGAVGLGYYSNGGGTSATPTAAGNGCLAGQECGKLAPGYYSRVTGMTTATPVHGTDCTGYYEEPGMSNSSFKACGMVAGGAYSTGGGSSAIGAGCAEGEECGSVAAGYYSNSGGTSLTPTGAGNGCLPGQSCGKVKAGYYSTGAGMYAEGVCNTKLGFECGTIEAGYWGEAGATTSKGSGMVLAGFYSNGGGTLENPYEAGNGCLDGQECGAIDAGYWNTGGGTSATPTTAGDGCVLEGTNGCGKVSAGYWNNGCGTNPDGRISDACGSEYAGGIISPGHWGEAGATTPAGSGVVDAGFYSTGGGTAARPTSPGNGCLKDKGCGQLLPGYWNDGCGINPKGGIDTSCSSSNRGGIIDAGYWGGYGATSSKGSGKVSAGYWNNGCGADPEGGIQSSCSQNQGGRIAAGYWGEAGATTQKGSGMVDAGYYSTGGATMPMGNGKVNAGYYNMGGGTSPTPVTRGSGCVNDSTTQCGTVEPGYWGAAGATSSTGSGQVDGGYFATGGATVAKPTASDCVGSGNTCGLINAGYWSVSGAKTATPTAKSDCIGMGGDYDYCGVISSGYYSTCGATYKYPATQDVDCAAGCECGAIQSGYYNDGCGIDDIGGVCSGDYKGGVVPAGYYTTDGSSMSPVAAGYYSTGGGTSPNGTCISGYECGAIAGGFYATGGGTTANGTCIDGKSCGLIEAGYYSTGGAKKAAPYLSNSCVGEKSDGTANTCGIVDGGYYSTGGGTTKTPTANGNGCTGSGKTCGKLAVAYYSNGGGTSATGTCIEGQTCGICDSNYRGGTQTGKTNVSQCQASCAAGTRVVSANAACTSPAGGWFTGAHLVNWGNISPVNYCMDGYTSTSTSASGHDAKSDCVQTVQGKMVGATTIAARYIKVTSSGSAKNSDTHMLEIQAFASADGTGTNLLSGKGGTTGSKLTAATDGSWTRGTTGETYAQGSTLVWDLGSVQNLGSIKFAMYTDGRVYQNMAISVSENNQDYTTVFQDADFQTRNTENPTGELVVLSAAPKACATGTYKASTTVALGNTVACNLADAGYFVGTTGASNQTKCVMGSYTDTTGQSACKACAGGKTNSADGATSCTATCSNATGVESTGWETPVWGTDNKMTNLCTIKATAGCSANYYKNSNACATCSSGTNSKYTLSAAGATTVNDCYLNTTATNYVANAGAGLVSCAADGYCPGSVKVYYGGTSSDTHPTTGGRTPCDESGDNVFNKSDVGADKYEQCYAITTPGNYVEIEGDQEFVTCSAGYYCPGGIKLYGNTAGGREECPPGYRDGTTGYSLESQCTMNVLGGKYVKVAKESSASGKCALGYAKEAHPVTYGELSSCDACTDATYADQEGMSKCEPCPTVSGASGYGYWNTSNEAGNHTVRAGCQASFKNASIADGNLTMYSCYVDASADTYGVKGDGKGCWVNKPDLTCNGGYYNKQFNDSTSATQDFTYKTSSDLLANVCRDVESGYWSGADSLTRTACATGLVTCGAGLCANEAGDCGRKLHAGDNVIYLRSEKRTGISPLLHLKVGEKMFYGNMSTTLSGPLKVKYNNTKYSVVNDNQ
ncbi:MAG: hypothetical protein J6R52_02405 [Alphaproteobacteria bacterium]|nr:hypothetical protein [Alphaproteobacteria bacterium]